ncbi:hypothetical protein E3O42_16860 [Cryobacterium adonitolivorans]|uniref:Polysaccharide transporter n=1 Tax=Cryobacterium adonitolivorans TaxID=1259189 RepID=A0A4R8W2S6_9MICO|nr:hypothetical protein [Cryobacterium adonitolivorans]TFB96808.1 hypothetical protein E3O42_16860 [Cryobacterium adonitolivorans]
MKQLFRLSLPTLGGGFARIAQLLVLVVLSSVAPGEERSVLVAGFGLLASFSILADAGGSNYILATADSRFGRKTFDRVISLQLASGLLGVFAAWCFLSYASQTPLTVGATMALAGIAISQVIDGSFRAIRAPLLVQRKDHVYGNADLCLFAAKIPIVLSALFLGQVSILWLLPLASLGVAVPVFLTVRKTLRRPAPIPSKLVRGVLEYGVTGGLSAFYSQSPMVVGSLYLAPAQLAVLAIVYRVIQPLELVPGIMSQQLLPRIRIRPGSPWRYWAAFASGGVVTCVIVVLLRAPIEAIFGAPFVPVAVFFIVALSIIPKFGNYALVAYLMGTGRIRIRLSVTIAVGASAVIGSLAVGPMGTIALASVTLASEILLATLIGVVIRKSRRSSAESAIIPKVSRGTQIK